MNAPLLLPGLPQFSDAIASLVAEAARMLCAIRVGPNRHITGMLWRPEVIVTCDQTLPAQDSYTVVLPPHGHLAPARSGRRDPATSLAGLQLDSPASAHTIRPAGTPSVGSLVLVLGTDLNANPTVRLTVVHRVGATGPLGATLALDLPSGAIEPGFVLDARGALVGMLALGRNGEAAVVPHAAIARFLDPLSLASHAMPRIGHSGRPWLGIALQPMTLPTGLRTVAGQQSGRMVISLTPNGPADQAGVKMGDILLTIDGETVSGMKGLRGVLGPERIGTAVEVRMLREGAVEDCSIIVAEHP